MVADTASGGPVDADQLVCHLRGETDRLVNSACLPGEIQVESAMDDSSMILGPTPVKVEEMTAVVCYQDAFPSDGERQHFGDRHPRIGIPCLQLRQYMVAEASGLRRTWAAMFSLE